MYREVLALLEARADIRVTCLRRGTRTPVHAEAGRLLPKIAFLPRQGVLGRYASVFTRFLLHPRRTGSLLALYARRPGGSTGDLFGKGPLDDPLHPGNAFALADALEAEPPAHLHAYGSTYPANVAMGTACLLDVPFSISSYVDFDFDYDFKLLAEKHRLARFFRVCTGFCKVALARMLGTPPDDPKVPVIVWGLDLADWEELAVPPGKAVLLTASRLVPKKGLHLVPPALATLVGRGLDPTWVVAGDGPEEARLRALVDEHGLRDRVRFMGPLPNGAVKELLLRCDVAVLPCVVAPGGERDGVPVFLTEAMACGVPVVSSPVSAVPEVVRHGETGFLAREGDAGALADCLESVLRDPAAARAAGRRGREFVLATHDARASARELLALVAAAEAP
jgi:glycosyltransferase involved in cell wall biosynthesis